MHLYQRIHFFDLARLHGTLAYNKLLNKMCKLHCNYVKLCSGHKVLFFFVYFLNGVLGLFSLPSSPLFGF